MAEEVKKAYVLGLVHDAVIDLVYYDRKECEDLPRGEIERLVSSGVISIDDMVSSFRDALERIINQSSEGS